MIYMKNGRATGVKSVINDMKIALIVPVLKRFDLFTKLMNSVDVEIRPYVIDNYNVNRGVAAAWNIGIRKALEDGYEYAIISNDDVVFEKESIKKIYECMIETGAVAISANPNNSINSESGTLSIGCDFFCFMININKLVEVCGYFDENFHPAYFEDNDMLYRIKLSGEKYYIKTDAPAYHFGSATQNSNPNAKVCPDNVFKSLQAYFKIKWGGLPNEETFSNPFNNSENSIKYWEKKGYRKNI